MLPTIIIILLPWAGLETAALKSVSLLTFFALNPDRKIGNKKQQGLCHLKCSKCVQNKQYDWSHFIGWSKPAIRLVQLHTLRSKVGRNRDKFPFLGDKSFVPEMLFAIDIFYICSGVQKSVHEVAKIPPPDSLLPLARISRNLLNRYMHFRAQCLSDKMCDKSLIRCQKALKFVWFLLEESVIATILYLRYNFHTIFVQSYGHPVSIQLVGEWEEVFMRRV